MVFSNLSENHTALQDRECKDCGEFKSYKDFPAHKHPSAKDGVVPLPRCKVCHSAWKNKAYIERKYKIKYEEYLRLLEDQEGLCKLCGNEGSGDNKRFVVDHCHETGKVRGLLCWNCNVGIGLFREDYKLLLKSSNYVKKKGKI